MAVIESLVSSDRARLNHTVARVIHDHGIVAVPTETFYGLAVDPFDAAAIGRLVHLKGRPDGKPLLVLIGDPAQLPALVQHISPLARVLMNAFWPGPLTLVFPAHPSIPSPLTAGTGTIGVRWTSCALLQPILQHVGPLTGTSANRSGAPPVCSARAVQEMFGDAIDLILDGGPTPGGPPSTVVEAGETVRVIRDGAVTRQMLRNVLETQGVSLT